MATDKKELMVEGAGNLRPIPAKVTDADVLERIERLLYDMKFMVPRDATDHARRWRVAVDAMEHARNYFKHQVLQQPGPEATGG